MTEILILVRRYILTDFSVIILFMNLLFKYENSLWSIEHRGFVDVVSGERSDCTSRSSHLSGTINGI